MKLKKHHQTLEPNSTLFIVLYLCDCVIYPIVWYTICFCCTSVCLCTSLLQNLAVPQEFIPLSVSMLNDLAIYLYQFYGGLVGLGWYIKPTKILYIFFKWGDIIQIYLLSIDPFLVLSIHTWQYLQCDYNFKPYLYLKSISASYKTFITPFINCPTPGGLPFQSVNVQDRIFFSSCSFLFVVTCYKS